MRPPIEDERKRLKIRNFRMSDEDWVIVEGYFKKKRIPVATGIRMILIEYIENKQAH